MYMPYDKNPACAADKKYLQEIVRAVMVHDDAAHQKA